MGSVVTLPVRKRKVNLEYIPRWFCQNCQMVNDRFVLAADGDVYCGACCSKQKNLYVGER
jgi:hypothetical protein